MKKVHIFAMTLLLGLPVFLGSCAKDEGFNLFSIEDDKKLGQQVKEQIAADTANYHMLDKTTYANVYNYMYTLRDNILNSGEVTHKDDFDWELYVIKDDSTLNAFCTPGGYIYVYTGLIKYLDNASSLAGVLGHEMGHADKRHSTEAMTKEYGISALLDIVLGKNQNVLTDVAQSLVNLQFSRDNEKEADKYSVIYLCPTKYHADGAANFFQKIVDAGTVSPPAFLSTHPNPENRINNIRTQASSSSCSGGTIPTTEDVNGYALFKALLP